MRYAVTYQVGGEEHIDELDATDAAAAVASVHEAHGRSPELFELISVQLLDAPDGTEPLTDQSELSPSPS
jgi:hypothetical protein